jgi:hypothetical protein
VFDLISLCIAQANDASNVAAIYEGNVVEPIRKRSECDHSRFVVSEPIVHPNKSLVPYEIPGECKG